MILIGNGSGILLKSDFRVPRISQKIGLRQFEQGFSSFFANFWAYLIIFPSFAATSARTFLIKYVKILAKNEEKPLSTCLKTFFLPKPETLVSGITRPITH